MNNPEISQREISALAAVVASARGRAGHKPAWDEAGIAAAIRKCPAVPYPELAVAFIKAAVDAKNETPASVTNLGNRAWDDGYWRCSTHPHYRARRVDGECGACYADRHATEYQIPERQGVPPTPETRQQLVAAINGGNR